MGEPEPTTQPCLTAQPVTWLKGPIKAGDSSLEVVNQDKLKEGDTIVIDQCTGVEEEGVVAGFGSVLLKDPIKNDHADGTTITLKTLTTVTTTVEPPAKAGKCYGIGASSTLDAAGFKAVTSCCCPIETEVFFGRLLEMKDLRSCSKPHIQGLMHWFTCVPDM